MGIPYDETLAKRFEFVSHAAGVEPTTFVVATMQGEEAISRLYRFEIQLVSDRADLDLEAILAAPATLRILSASSREQVAPYSGMLAEFDRVHCFGDYTVYRAVLVPRLWQLSLRRESQVYLGKTVPALIKELLTAAQLGGQTDLRDVIKVKQQGTPEDPNTFTAREFICQYQETQLDFISRWMEREGIYYCFEPADAQHERLVLLNDCNAHASLPSPDPQVSSWPLSYYPAGGGEVASIDRGFQALSERTRQLPQQVVLQDFNERKAGQATVTNPDQSVRNIPLRVTWPEGSTAFRQELLFGENFETEQQGKRYARMRWEEIRCRARRFYAESTAFGLRAGLRVTLDSSEAQYAVYNGDYVLTEVHHRGSQVDALTFLGVQGRAYFGNATGIHYQNEFIAIPASTQFRAPLATPKPQVAGTMSAFVDSMATIAADAPDLLGQLGSYRVQMLFDAKDRAPGQGSAPVRLASPYAGSDHGMHFPLQQGAEVLLSFTNGDPDRPVILSAVPDSLNPSLVNQNNAKLNRIVSAGKNAIVLDDAKDNEALWLQSPGNTTTLGLGVVGTKTHKGQTPALTALAPTKAPGSEAGAEAADESSDASQDNTGLVMVSQGGLQQYVHKKEEIWTGTRFELGVGSKAGIGASFGVDFSVGASVSVGASWGASLKLFGDSTDFKLSTEGLSGEFDTTGLDSHSIKAGVDPANALSFNTQQRVMAGLIASYAAANLAYQAALKFDVIDWGNKGTSLYLQPGLNASFMVGLYLYKRRLQAQKKAIKANSKINLNAAGITGYVGTNGETDGSVLELTKSSVALRTKWTPPPPATTPGTPPPTSAAELVLTSAGAATLRSNGAAQIEAGSTLTLDGKSANGSSKVEMTEAVKLLAGGSKLEVQRTSIVAQSDTVEIGAGVPSLDNPAKEALEAQLKAAAAARDTAKVAFVKALMATDAAKGDDASVLPLAGGDTPALVAARTAEGIAEKAYVAAEEVYNNLEALYLATPAHLPTPQPVSGLVVKGAGSAKVYAGAAKVETSATAATLEFGASKLTVDASGLSGDGVLIRLG